MDKWLKRMLPFVFSGLILAALAAPATALTLHLDKSIYVLTDQGKGPNDATRTPLSAYLLDEVGDALSYQGQHWEPGVPNDPTGFTIDTPSKTLFMAVGNTIQAINAWTGQYLSASSYKDTRVARFGGIVMDENASLLYAVDYGTANLYVYQWNRTTKKLSPSGSAVALAAPWIQTGVVSAGPTTAAGIALDTVNHLLYVANNSLYVFVYNTGTWTWYANALSNPGLDTLSQYSYGGQGSYSIAIDSANQLLYTGNEVGGLDSGLLQLNLSSGVLNWVSVPQYANLGGDSFGVMGLAVDPFSSYVYASTAYDWGSDWYGGDPLVYNSSLSLLKRFEGIGYTPSGVAIPSSDDVIFHHPALTWLRLLLQ